MDTRVLDFLKQEQVGRAKQILDELELLLGIDLPGDDSDEGHAAGEIRAALKLVAKEIGDKMRRIETDPDLSPQGRAKAFASLASTMRPRLQGLERAIMPRLQTRLDDLRGELTAPMPVLQKTDAVGAIRQMEIRNRLNPLDEGSRLSALWRAVEQGDAETLAAFTTAPKSFALVDGEALAQALDAYYRQVRPDVVAQVEQVESLMEMLATNFRSLGRVCDNLAGLVSDDPAAGTGSK